MLASRSRLAHEQQSTAALQSIRNLECEALSALTEESRQLRGAAEFAFGVGSLQFGEIRPSVYYLHAAAVHCQFDYYRLLVRDVQLDSGLALSLLGWWQHRPISSSYSFAWYVRGHKGLYSQCVSNGSADPNMS